MGLLGRGLPYRFFKAIERYQYSVANVIGVQTPANQPYFDVWSSTPGRSVEVLQNWLADAPDVGCSISVAKGPLAGRTIFVYAGNMGIAQGMGILIDLAERLLSRKDIGFLFVGRGSDAQCHVGVVALDPRHKTHNIPGKFLSYMQAGLPVLASINAENDLEGMILREGVGRVCTDQSVVTLQRLALELTDEAGAGAGGNAIVAARCKALSAKHFSPEAAVRQIVAALRL